MPDMLVKLYDLPFSYDPADDIKDPSVKIKRSMAPDINKIFDFIKTNFGEGWAYECQKACYNNPPTCYIAVREKRIIGFACYEATALNYFGPVGVLESERGNNIGKALTLCCLHAMRNMGYGYAVIGWVGPDKFYEKICGAKIIENSSPGIYKNFIAID